MTTDAADLLEAHPKCRVCGEPSETVRQPGQPPWGLDDAGFPNRTVEAWLATDPTPDEAVGVCWDHLRWSQNSQGGFTAPLNSAIPKADRGNWMVRAAQARKNARENLIAALGGACTRCGNESPEDLARIFVRGYNRQQYDIGTRHEWYEFVQQHDQLLDAAELLCPDCNPAQPSTDPKQMDLREAAIQAYGGRCWKPDCKRTQGLMISAKPGTQTLRWPNGDKYNSRAKLKWLARHGYPQGWAVSCPAHLTELQHGRRGE